MRWAVNESLIAAEYAKLAAGAAERAAFVAQKRIRWNIAAKDRIRTTAMFGQITVKPFKPNWYRVESPQFYSMYQEYGVKPFGPKRARFLRFKPKGSNKFVYAKRVKGFPPGHFFRDTLRSMKVSDFLG